MKKNNHFIFDFETIGQSIFTAPIVNCAYFVFDFNRFTSDEPYTFKELIGDIRFVKFDIKEQLAAGYKFKKRDIQWWQDLGPAASKQIIPSSDDIAISEFVTRLTDYLSDTKIVRWWSRANCFDPILLQRIFEDVSNNDELNKMLPFWHVRDIRTYIDTRFDFKIKKNAFCPIDDVALWDKYFVAHNSIHDVAADILRLQKIERSIFCDN